MTFCISKTREKEKEQRRRRPRRRRPWEKCDNKKNTWFQMNSFILRGSMTDLWKAMPFIDFSFAPRFGHLVCWLCSASRLVSFAFISFFLCEKMAAAEKKTIDGRSKQKSPQPVALLSRRDWNECLLSAMCECDKCAFTVLIEFSLMCARGISSTESLAKTHAVFDVWKRMRGVDTETR